MHRFTGCHNMVTLHKLHPYNFIITRFEILHKNSEPLKHISCEIIWLKKRLDFNKNFSGVSIKKKTRLRSCYAISEVLFQKDFCIKSVWKETWTVSHLHVFPHVVTSRHHVRTTLQKPSKVSPNCTKRKLYGVCVRPALLSAPAQSTLPVNVFRIKASLQTH